MVQLHPIVGFLLIQVNSTHLSEFNSWCNCGTIPQLHCSLTPIRGIKKLFFGWL